MFSGQIRPDRTAQVRVGVTCFVPGNEPDKHGLAHSPGIPAAAQYEAHRLAKRRLVTHQHYVAGLRTGA